MLPGLSGPPSVPRHRQPLRPPVGPDINVARAALDTTSLDRCDRAVGAIERQRHLDWHGYMVMAGAAPEHQIGVGCDVGEGGGGYDKRRVYVSNNMNIFLNQQISFEL